MCSFQLMGASYASSLYFLSDLRNLWQSLYGSPFRGHVVQLKESALGLWRLGLFLLDPLSSMNLGKWLKLFRDLLSLSVKWKPHFRLQKGQGRSTDDQTPLSLDTRWETSHAMGHTEGQHLSGERCRENVQLLTLLRLSRPTLQTVHVFQGP